jgi:hypothetical protein
LLAAEAVLPLLDTVKEVSTLLPTTTVLGVTEPVAVRSIVGVTTQLSVTVADVAVVVVAHAASDVSVATTCMPLLAFSSVKVLPVCTTILSTAQFICELLPPWVVVAVKVGEPPAQPV